MSNKGKLSIAILSLIVAVSFIATLFISSVYGIENFGILPWVAVVDAVLYCIWIWLHRERLEA